MRLLNGLSFLLFLFYFNDLKAGTNSLLQLQAYVPSANNTTIKQYILNNEQSVLVFSNQSNDIHSSDTQKIELDDNNLDKNISLKEKTHLLRSTQYEIVIKNNPMLLQNSKPIFIKITAN